MLDINPRNREKSKFYFFLRSIEDHIKNFFLLLIVFLSFFFKINSKEKKILDLGKYIDIYSINYIVFSLSPKYLFTYNLKFCLPLIRRLGIKTFFQNCKPNILFKNRPIKVFYNKINELNDNELNFNFDYFKPFDHDDFKTIQLKKSIILPYYTRAEFYRKNLFKKYEQLRNKKKIFQILFSGSSHPDWYDQLKWQTSHENKKGILSRSEILNFVKTEFKDDVQIIYNRKQITEIDNKKKIILLISDPSQKRKLSKILTMDEHIEFISSSKFFLTCPGTAMPLCHHIVESMFVGTVPISSYGNLLFPKLDHTNSLIFNNYSDLYESVKKALTIDDDEFNLMRKCVLAYYNQNLSPSAFLRDFQSLKFPTTLYMNIDGHTLDSRRERLGLPRLFPLPKN